MVSPVTAIQIIGRASEFAFATRGRSASSGSRPTARAMRSRTSLAAPSISRVDSNSMLTEEDSSRLVEVMVSMPAMPAMASSTTWVTWVSMIGADAPR